VTGKEKTNPKPSEHLRPTYNACDFSMNFQVQVRRQIKHEVLTAKAHASNKNHKDNTKTRKSTKYLTTPRHIGRNSRVLKPSDQPENATKEDTCRDEGPQI